MGLKKEETDLFSKLETFAESSRDFTTEKTNQNSLIIHCLLLLFSVKSDFVFCINTKRDSMIQLRLNFNLHKKRQFTILSVAKMRTQPSKTISFRSIKLPPDVNIENRFFCVWNFCWKRGWRWKVWILLSMLCRYRNEITLLFKLFKLNKCTQFTMSACLHVCTALEASSRSLWNGSSRKLLNRVQCDLWIDWRLPSLSFIGHTTRYA